MRVCSITRSVPKHTHVAPPFRTPIDGHLRRNDALVDDPIHFQVRPHHLGLQNVVIHTFLPRRWYGRQSGSYLSHTHITSPPERCRTVPSSRRRLDRQSNPHPRVLERQVGPHVVLKYTRPVTRSTYHHKSDVSIWTRESPLHDIPELVVSEPTSIPDLRSIGANTMMSVGTLTLSY